MSDDVTAAHVRVIRRARAGLAAVFALEVAVTAVTLARSAVAPIGSLAGMMVIACAICVQTVRIRRLRALARRVDWSAVALMEWSIYGETFAHDGSPIPATSAATGSPAELSAFRAHFS